MRMRRIAGVVMTHCVEYLKKSEWLEIIVWWITNILMFGFLGKSVTLITANPTTGLMIIIAIVAARPVIMQGSAGMGRVITDELSGHTFTASMATPITFLEWTVATGIVGSIGTLIRWALGYVLVILFFNVSSLVLAGKLLLLMFPLLITGWIFGVYLSAMAYGMGKKSISFIKVLGWSVVTISGTWCPVSALPHALQKIAWLSPMTYVFEGLRAQLTTGTMIWPNITTSLALNACYLVPAVLIALTMFKQAKKNGFTQLETK